MAREEELDVKRLAEMKAYLERKIADSQQEVERLRSFLEVVDSLLAEKSFKPVKITAETKNVTTKESLAEPSRPVSEIWPITSADGVHLADLRISESELTLVPESTIRYDVVSPPLKAFLIARVLDPMHAKDEEAVRAGSLEQNDALSYELEENEGALEILRVRKYGNSARLAELRNAIRWTIRRMYEKTLQPR